jgi:hypothetical protein
MTMEPALFPPLVWRIQQRRRRCGVVKKHCGAQTYPESFSPSMQQKGGLVSD